MVTESSQDETFHEAVFYEEDNALLDTTARWLYEEVAKGCSAIIIATEAHRFGLVSRLNVLGGEYARAVQQRRVALLDAEKCLDRIMAHGGPERALFRRVLNEALYDVQFTSSSCSAVAAYGEMVAVLCQRGEVAAAVRLEELWNEALSEYPIKLRCGYCVKDLKSDEGRAALSGICGNHTHLSAEVAERAKFGREYSAVVEYLKNCLV